MKVSQLLEAVKIKKFDLIKGKKFSEKNLSLFKADLVDEIDTDDLDRDSEGNLEGYLTILFKDSTMFEIKGESFSPALRRFNKVGTKAKQRILDELVEKIKNWTE